MTVFACTVSSKLDGFGVKFSTDLRGSFPQTVENLVEIDTFRGKTPWDKAFCEEVFHSFRLWKSGKLFGGIFLICSK